MTKADVKTFRTTLEKMQTELAEANKEPIMAEPTSDELDRIQQATEREYAIGSLERNFTRMREVSAALRRLNMGTFGVCVSCEEEITPKRLAAVPWAPFCLVCQETADQERTKPSPEIDESQPALA
jgi:RNA polymerase-binding transcription factor